MPEPAESDLTLRWNLHQFRLAVLLQLCAAMTQFGFHDQTKLISLQYQNVGSDDAHSKSPCHHPRTSTTSLLFLLKWMKINHKSKVDPTGPERKIDKSTTAHNKNKETAAGCPCRAIWCLLQPVEDLHCGCACLVVGQAPRGQMEVSPPGHWLLLKTNTEINLLAGPNPPQFITN